MQKKIIALAVAGLVSGVAFAQSNVTVYGVADIAYNYAKQGDNKYSGLQDGGDVGLQGSRIGFRGEEALGNGLKAIFTVEFGLNLAEGQGQGFNNHRQTFVGLSGNFGSVTMGRQYAPSGVWLGGTSSNAVTSVNFSNYFLGLFTTMNTGNGSRWSNSVAYESPNLSGFQVRGIYAFHPETSNIRDSFGDATKDNSRFGLGVKYANGPLYLTAIYQAVLKDSTVPSGVVGSGSDKAWAVGGSYDFKVVKVFANYIREKDDYLFDGLKKTYFSLGVGVPVSAAGTVKVELGQFKTDVKDTKSKGGSIGYEHAFSKRTTLYTYVTRFTNDDDALPVGRARALVAVGAAGESQLGFAAGINHKF